MDSLNFKYHTFGCKVNTYDTGLIQKNFKTNFKRVLGEEAEIDSNLKESQKAPQVHILNTCAVTAEATKEAVRLIRRLKSKDPLALVVVTGCAAQVDTGHFENLPGADLVVANSHKGLLPQIISDYYKGRRDQKIFKSNIFRNESLGEGGGYEQSHTRSFLKIQDGCNSFCTYCIIPYARGKSRSISIRDLVSNIKEIEKSGVKEVVLTGVHIGDYDDHGLKLEDLLEAVLSKTAIPRFRLTSLEPVEVTERLLKIFENPRMCSHFHMSIQSAENETLKNMKRNYGESEVIQSLQRIRELYPNAYIGMDVIAGFPTETAEQFERTYQVLSETPWTRLHVFPYSERQGTKAAAMTETVPWTERLQRAQKLRELSLHRIQSHALAQKDTVKEVLLLNKPAKGGAQGLAKDYWPVKIKGLQDANYEALKGQEVLVRIEAYEHPTGGIEGYLVGELIEKN